MEDDNYFDEYQRTKITAFILVFIALVVILFVYVSIFVFMPKYTQIPNTINSYGIIKMIEPHTLIKTKTWSDILNSPAYIINLDKSKSRWNTASNNVKNAGFTNIRRLVAVNGRELKENDPIWNQYGRGDKNFLSYSKDKKVIKAEKGCLLSWLKVLNVIKNDTENDVATVFEDDCVFANNWNQAKYYYDLTPNNYDMIYLGCTGCRVWNNLPIIQTRTLSTHAIHFTREGARKCYNYIINSEYFRVIDRFFYEEICKNTDILNSYVWNANVSYDLINANRGLVFQDKIIESTILK